MSVLVNSNNITYQAAFAACDSAGLELAF